jgi:hypothetical protein
MSTATAARTTTPVKPKPPRKPRLANENEESARFTQEEERFLAFVAATEHLRSEARALLNLRSLPVDPEKVKGLRRDLAAFSWQLDAFASAWEYVQSFEMNQEIAIRGGMATALMVRLEKEGQPVPDDVRASAMEELNSAFGK